jgi:hypothetical protein
MAIVLRKKMQIKLRRKPIHKHAKANQHVLHAKRKKVKKVVAIVNNDNVKRKKTIAT